MAASVQAPAVTASVTAFDTFKAVRVAVDGELQVADERGLPLLRQLALAAAHCL
eukprot:CAMPEP_0176068928 /NCGR_PEP_ID=MMETSP0120_2-20121206/34410_1 /TAXON_ID=160619 /ORGANISM="Kryptoperidinium foliaceum, Strain CCMP 1326" /LENGTH=53 /DNA_ID=CAMNT_0017402553 /DNA_START=316 /DNA_END=473 /DNA_ORIENTATION=-